MMKGKIMNQFMMIISHSKKMMKKVMMFYIPMKMK